MVRINLIKGIIYNFLIALVAPILTWIFGGPKIDIEFETALILFLILFIPFLIIILWNFHRKLCYCERNDHASLLNSVKIFENFIESARDVKRNAHKYIRYPVCAAVIFLLNPALAVIFRSWIYLLACVVIYFVWKSLVENEEVRMAKEWGNDYRQYRLETNLFFPDVYSISRPLYFFLIGVLVFIFVFVILNFPSLSLRYVGWENDDNLSAGSHPIEIANNQTAADVSRVNEPETQETIYDKPDSIVIEKIGVNAPLVYAQSADQRAMDRALDDGVVIYPGSVSPGQIGNFFLTGHSSVYPWNKTKYGQVFAALDKLKIGDVVAIYLQKRKYEYRITNKYTTAAEDVRLVHPADEAKITLMTCWPIGTALKRLIVDGVLTDSH